MVPVVPVLFQALISHFLTTVIMMLKKTLLNARLYLRNCGSSLSQWTERENTATQLILAASVKLFMATRIILKRFVYCPHAQQSAHTASFKYDRAVPATLGLNSRSFCVQLSARNGQLNLIVLVSSQSSMCKEGLRPPSLGYARPNVGAANPLAERESRD